jgi:hypothetical protein
MTKLAVDFYIVQIAKNLMNGCREKQGRILTLSLVYDAIEAIMAAPMHI